MLADKANSHEVRLADIFEDLVDLSIALRTRLHHDVTGIHTETFDRHSHGIAGVPHALQLVEIKGAARGSFRRNKSTAARVGRSKRPADACLAFKNHFRIWADMPDAETQVVFEVLPRHDAAALGDVIVGADVHHRIFPGSAAGFLRLAGRGQSSRRPRYAGAKKTTGKPFTEIPASHPTLLLEPFTEGGNS